MGLKKTAFFLSITLSVVLLFGCSDTHKQASPKDTFSDELPKETVSASQPIENQTQAEPVIETADQNTASRQDSEAQQKLMFAKNNLKLAQKGILGYSQVVALCRGVIADFPGTEYEQEAREILQQIPEDQRDRYKLTDQELGLQNGNE